jgi:hypothetical protein
MTSAQRSYLNTLAQYTGENGASAYRYRSQSFEPFPLGPSAEPCRRCLSITTRLGTGIAGRVPWNLTTPVSAVE